MVPSIGEGYDEKLMKKVLQLVDDSELPCYLECTDPALLEFYKAHGFFVEEYHEQPTLSYMLRPEQKKGSAPVAPAPGKGCYFLVFVPTIREIRDFYREM